MKSNQLTQIFTLIFLCINFLIFSQPTSWTSKGVGGGGAIVSASISPFNQNELYLTCDMSNLFRSSDFGQSYTMTPFTQLQVQLKSEVQYTSSQTKLFILNKPSVYVPSKSYDGGQTWINTSNPCTGSAYQQFASPHDTDQVVLSDQNKIYFSNTENILGSFTTLFTYPGTYGGHVAGVYFENKDSIFVCSHDSLIFTLNGGQTWSNSLSGTNGIPSDEHIISFKGAKEGGKWVFYCVTIQANLLSNIYNSSGRDCTAYKGIYKLSQDQSTWTALGNNLPLPSVDKGYLLGLASNDTSVVYIGGNSTYLGGNPPVQLGAIFKSIDGGNSFVNTFLNAGTYQSNDNFTTGWAGTHTVSTAKFKWNGLNYILALAVDPNNSSRIISGDGMWAHSSTDFGTNWQQIYTDFNFDNTPSTLLDQTKEYKTTGLETTASYWLNWSSPTHIFASYNDIVARRTVDGGQKWSFDINGLDSNKINDINMTVYDSNSGLLYAAAGEQPGSNGDYTDTRVNQFRGRISVSSDNGQNWSSLYNFSKSAVTSIALDPNSTTNGMYATVLDVIGGNGGVYHCTDVINNSQVWTRLTSPPRTEGRALQIKVLNDGGLIAVYGARNGANSGPATYTASSGVFYSNDGGLTWFDNNPSFMQIEAVNVEIDPNDVTQNTWLAFVGAKSINQVQSAPGVYRTTDRGVNWTNVYNQAVLSGTFHPTLPNEVYICTENKGLLYATNTNSNSFAITPVSSFPFRRPQKVFFNPYNLNEVWVSTFGNGFRMGTTNLSLGIKKNESNKLNFTIYPNPANETLNFSEYLAEFTILNYLGQEILTGKGNFVSTAELKNGIYMLRNENSCVRFIVKH
ncbi:MAG: hypothetical protein V4622_13785 [Bacteroidota bacterium]